MSGWPNIPNTLTLLRIALIPVFILVFYLPTPWAPAASAGLFVLSAATDWLDGYLARRLRQTSAFGAFLDPVADKLLVAVALVLLVQTNATPIFAVPAAVVVGREIVVSGLREWMAEVGERAQVAVSTIGKVKTLVQMSAITLLLYEAPVSGFPTHAVGMVLFYLAAALTLWSMAVYLRAAWPMLRPE